MRENIILIPAYRRPVMLHLNLNSLIKCDGIRNYRLLFALDGSHDRQAKEIIDNSCSNLDREIIERSTRYGLSKNILEGMKMASKNTRDYFIVIEEDVRVTKDFLKWQEYVHEHFFKDNILASYGFAYENKSRIDQSMIEEVRLTDWYVPYGTLISKRVFQKYILPHCNDKYYQDRKTYLKSHFSLPVHIANIIWSEQAGLIQHIRLQNNLICLSPALSRVQHMGYGGRNSIEEVKKVLEQEKLYRKYRSDFAKFRKTYSWNQLKLKQYRPELNLFALASFLYRRISRNKPLHNLIKVVNPIRPMIEFIKYNIPSENLVGAEIGTYEGQNAYNILSNLSIKKLYLIDPYAPYSADKGWKGTENVFKRAQKRLKSHSNKTVFIKKLSEDATNNIREKLDFVYIDGNHSYEYVKRDIELYYSKVKKGGIIGGHDFTADHLEVSKAVWEYAHKYDLILHGKESDWWIIKE